MTIYTTGAEALAALTAENGGGNASQSFAPFKSGSSYRVRVMTAQDLVTYYGYSIFKVVNTFVADSPSTLGTNGFPKDNLTLWDKASDYYAKLAFAAEDEKAKETLMEQSRQYRGKLRFIVAFIDLDTALPIYVDLSKAQAQAVHAVIAKAGAAGKLGKKAFELEKNGSGTSTTVALPQMDLDELTEKQASNFEKVADFAGYNYDGLLYEANEAEQAKFLTQAGFDLSLIGVSPEAKGSAETAEDGDFPF